jgi:alanyl-tRNA synthetase
MNGFNLLAVNLDLSSVEQLKNLSFQLKSEIPNLMFFAAANIAEKPFLSLIIDENLVNSNAFHAGKIIKELAPVINGGGGGQDFYATAGGSNLLGLNKAVEDMLQLITNYIQKI